MTSDMSGRSTMAVGLLLLALMVRAGVTENATVRLAPDTEYVYGYSAFSHLKHTALVKVTAEV